MPSVPRACTVLSSSGRPVRPSVRGMTRGPSTRQPSARRARQRPLLLLVRQSRHQRVGSDKVWLLPNLLRGNSYHPRRRGECVGLLLVLRIEFQGTCAWMERSILQAIRVFPSPIPYPVCLAPAWAVFQRLPPCLAVRHQVLSPQAGYGQEKCCIRALQVGCRVLHRPHSLRCAPLLMKYPRLWWKVSEQVGG